MITDMYSIPAKFESGDVVYKHGTGYSGPGKVFGTFVAADGNWRYIIGHKIEGGQGWFYHIYGASQFEAQYDEEARK